jgi:hypothetical protein
MRKTFNINVHVEIEMSDSESADSRSAKLVSWIDDSLRLNANDDALNGVQSSSVADWSRQNFKDGGSA